MNKRIGRLGAAFTAAFLILVLNLTYLQFLGAQKLAAKPENVRPLLTERRIERGDIISADNVVLARSHADGAGYVRSYPERALAAPITGFYSTKYGRAGLELTYNDYLSGKSKVSSLDGYMKRLLGKDVPGNTITLTLDMRLERAAAQALGTRKGAVVALDPRTGAVLALVSRPSYDPNKIDTDWEALSGGGEGVLVNRVTQGRFVPGSSFKIVSAAAALERGRISPSTTFEAPAQLTVHGGKVTNYEGTSFGEVSFETAFAKSINTVFAQTGVDLGGDKLVAESEQFGFNRDIPFDLPTSMSKLPAAKDMDPLEVAWMAVGQGRIEASPLSMALVGAAVANRGEIRQPYLVARATEHDGTVVFERKPRTWLRPVSEETAEALAAMMEKVVVEGTGGAARINGVRVAGKTGTAEVGKGAPHAWFVGFAPADDPTIVVAVIVENAGTGGKVAAPIAKEVMKTWIGKND
ncbi:MAG TPA: hypothetical protein DE036_03780 [Actinobacteria bacterium]|nr:hypothetical protein [Actinomycetota bacterium]